MKKLRSPIVWFGGKGHSVSRLLKLIPEHLTYIEVFGGGASLLFAKPPSPVEVYNDIDSGLVNFFRVLRDPDMFGRFYGKVVLIPFSREEFKACKETWDKQGDPVESAVRWFVVARQSFSGVFGKGWGYSRSSTSGGMAMKCKAWLSALELLPYIHARMIQVQVENRDFRKILETYDSPETFFYLDPPYHKDTRKNGRYRHEMNSRDHRDLVKLLLEIKGKALLSGYSHPDYLPLEKSGWQRLDYTTTCMAVGKTRCNGLLGKGSVKKKHGRIES
ncbi:MAG: DNA adenine methylase, partial [Candidatus Eremiobacteraeota bacterium]|nr:DNA adenine methylase [Candidatus Eremiobacteraeota bacterium]